MKNNTTFFYTVIFTIFTSVSFAGDGHNHGEEVVVGSSHNSPIVQITPQVMKNINLKIAKAEKRKIDNIVTATGTVDFIPQNVSTISSRVAGQVKDIFVSSNQYVKKGEKLFTLQTRVIGSNAPIIEFVSPRDGIVEFINISQGSPVDSSSELLKIVDISKMYGIANVFESKLENLRVGQNARIRLESYPNSVFDALLVKLGNKLDEKTVTLPVFFELENPDKKIKSGMRGIFSISTDSGDKKNITIERSALLGDFGNYFVFIEKCPKDLEYERRPVVVGKSDDKYIEILEGLKDGDSVAIEGTYQLQFMPSAESNSHKDKKDSHSCESGDGQNHTHVSEVHAHSHSDGESCSHAGVDENSVYKNIEDLIYNLSDKSYFKYFFYILLIASLCVNMIFIVATILSRKEDK